MKTGYYKERLTKEFLLREYIDNKKSTRALAAEVGCSACTVGKALKFYDIPRRPQWVKPQGPSYRIPDKDVISSYLDNGKTIRQLAKEFGCRQWYICSCLRKNGFTRFHTKIDVRDYTGPAFSERELWDFYHGEKKTISQIAAICGVPYSKIQQALKKLGIQTRQGLECQFRYISNEVDHRYRDKDWLHNKYIVERKNSTDIAEMCSAGRTTIKRWLKRHNIELRTNSESHMGHVRSEESKRKQSKSISGDKHYFYGKHHTEHSKWLLSVQHSGNNSARYGKPPNWGWCSYFDKNGKVHKFQSSWELKYAEYLDDNNIEWESHKGMRRFKYVNKGGEAATYGPDFYLPETDEYIEIKGWYHDQDKYKMKSVINNYPDVKLVMLFKKDLEKLGVI